MLAQTPCVQNTNVQAKTVSIVRHVSGKSTTEVGDEVPYTSLAVAAEQVAQVK